MKRYKNKYRIETTRLATYDYASAGWYHVVACTKKRVCCFGEVVDGEVRLSKIGRIAHRFCEEIPDHFDRAVLDAFVIMPNHVHVIVGLLPRENPDNVHVEARDLTSHAHQDKEFSAVECLQIAFCQSFPRRRGSREAAIRAGFPPARE